MNEDKIIIKKFRESCLEELGYISGIFMSQGETKAGEIIMPTEKLIEATDRLVKVVKQVLKSY